MNPYDATWPLLAKEAGVRPPHVFHLHAALRHMGAKFNAAVYAEFARIDLRHVESMIATLDAHGMLPKRAVREGPRGVRLAIDWSMPDDWRAFARNERHWTDAEIDAEAALFRDYWHSQPGQRGVKLDWFATWRNWCRNSRRPSGTPVTIREDFDANEYQHRMADLYDKMGRTTEAAEIRARLNANVIPLLRSAG